MAHNRLSMFSQLVTALAQRSLTSVTYRGSDLVPWPIWEVTDSIVDFCLWRQNGRVVINDGLRISDPAYSRLFQLRSEEGLDYRERVQ